MIYDVVIAVLRCEEKDIGSIATKAAPFDMFHVQKSTKVEPPHASAVQRTEE